MASKSQGYRFINAAQLAYMAGLRLPALIVPIGYAESVDGPWFFETTSGPIPQPVSNDVAQKVLRRQVSAWRIVPGGLAMAVEWVADSRDEFEAFERWLIENNYPFDRLD